jgi:hypothetical protein
VAAKDQIEVALYHRLRDLFSLKPELVLYDITSTYFEGQAAANPQARRGHSRDHRRDCKQVLIGLVVSRDGYPWATRSSPAIVTTARRCGRSSRAWRTATVARDASGSSTAAWSAKPTWTG